MITLHPGFPLTSEDYAPLLHALPPGTHDTLAHSLGALDALATPWEGTLVLLAPSTPRRRPLRPLLRAALLAAHHSPWSAALAERMRRGTFTHYGATVSPGSALRLDVAAERLRARRVVASPMGRVVVVCARADARHPEQLRFATTLGAEVRWAPGGHLFPITHPEAAAALIANGR